MTQATAMHAMISPFRSLEVIRILLLYVHKRIRIPPEKVRRAKKQRGRSSLYKLRPSPFCSGLGLHYSDIHCSGALITLLDVKGNFFAFFKSLEAVPADR